MPFLAPGPAALGAYRRTTHAVWELTLKCNLACGSCGSRAGEARADELSTEEALDLCAQLAEVGVKEVSLIGGEAYLRADLPTIVAELHRLGVVATMVTGGLGLGAGLAKKLADAGLTSASVSVDGLEATHDEQRGVQGSWQAAFRAMRSLREAGVYATTNTQINRGTLPELEALYEAIRDVGVVAWQLQLTVPMGRAADRPDWLLQPHELLELFPRLAALAERGLKEGLRIRPGNNVGYFGPFETVLRGGGNPDAHWMGCQAGVAVLGIEADGAIKGCPSLPSASYTGGNVRQQRLSTIIQTAPELNFNREELERPEYALWGRCQGCYYAELCRGGCTWTSHVLLGKRGNNPYCHHRALELQSQGLRERLVQVEAAPGLPFDHGRFELVEEAWPT